MLSFRHTSAHHSQSVCCKSKSVEALFPTSEMKCLFKKMITAVKYVAVQ